ncbi:unnamed protein product [Triticum turgidum subsp. durum]|uniref:F-box domain-containing protein n=1 Tax=Triticum turgidum subsp. durum TaxID=4567 RepID=A0A9R0Z4G4_TRITD|nr:unnamed protein product [Triticum turgidum subsp. durum]
MAPPVVRELWEMEELVEKILLSIPPEEPEILVRASLACKPWCRLLSGNAFRSRYLALHGTAPVLGFLQSWVAGDLERFVPTKKFCPRSPIPKLKSTFVHDCRHGRVLLGCLQQRDEAVVWDPVSGRRTELREPDYFCAAAVLCSVDGCDHAACNSGPFSVACIEDEGCVDDDEHSLLLASVYSSYTQKWTSPACIHIGFVSDDCFMGRPSLLIGKQLYFLLDHGLGILRYDLSRHRLSVIDLPEKLVEHNPLLISGPGGRLGVVHQDKHGLCVVYSRWSIDGEYRWLYSRAIDLNMLRPIVHPMSSHPPVLAGSLEGTDLSIVVTDLGVFTFDRKSLSLRSFRVRSTDMVGFSSAHLSLHELQHHTRYVYLDTSYMIPMCTIV